MDPVRRLVTEQRSRLVATLLSRVEPQLRPLGEEQWQQTRKAVMDAVGVYHDLILDVLKVSREDGMSVNEDVLRLIEAVHASSRRIEDTLNGRSESKLSGRSDELPDPRVARRYV